MKINSIVCVTATTLLATLSALSSSAQTCDTLVNVNQASKLVITEDTRGTNIIVKDVEDDENEDINLTVEYPPEASVQSTQSNKRVLVEALLHPNKFRRRVELDFGVEGICLGLTQATGCGSSETPEWSKSIEIGWLSCLSVGYFYRNSGFTIGIGFNWRNYKITTPDYRFAVTPVKGLEMVPYLPDENPKYSRLKIFSLQLPILYRLHISGTSLGLKVGPILNFNTYGSVKTIYQPAEGKRIEDFNKDINQRRFTLDFFGSLSLNKTIGVYVRYSPMTVMDAPGSFNFRPFTIGIGIGI